MKPSHPSIPASLVTSSKQALDSYAAPIDGLQMALLTTPDGFEIASLRNRSDLQVNRLAAMASSLMAMGRAVGREIQVSNCNRLTLRRGQRSGLSGHWRRFSLHPVSGA